MSYASEHAGDWGHARYVELVTAAPAPHLRSLRFRLQRILELHCPRDAALTTVDRGDLVWVDAYESRVQTHPRPGWATGLEHLVPLQLYVLSESVCRMTRHGVMPIEGHTDRVTGSIEHDVCSVYT